MKRTLRIVVVLASLGLCVVLVDFSRFQTSASALGPVSAAAPTQSVALACPGRIEGRTETVEVGAGIDGIIDTIRVTEGQQVKKGDVVATLSCKDLEASLDVVKSEADSLRQVRTRLMRGSRTEEREAAAQKTAAAKAVLERAVSKLDRMTKLHAAAAISRESFEEAKRDFDVAQADLRHAMRTEELVDAGPLQEEVARANADLDAAGHRIQLAQDKLGKCVVKAPMSGTVLRVNLRAGESFALLSPRPILTMADLSGRRVRAEVDERDVQAARGSGNVFVTSDASGQHRFAGRIIRVSPTMGKKSVLTGDPTDKHDRDVLEVLAELGPGSEELPIGLRVTVQFIR